LMIPFGGQGMAWGGAWQANALSGGWQHPRAGGGRGDRRSAGGKAGGRGATAGRSTGRVVGGREGHDCFLPIVSPQSRDWSGTWIAPPRSPSSHIIQGVRIRRRSVFCHRDEATGRPC
jgi:hypothetical protein